MLRKIKEKQKDLIGRMPKLSIFNLTVNEHQISYCQEKQALAEQAFTEYEKIKDNPAFAMDAVELLMIAFEAGSQKAFAEINTRSFSQVALPDFVVDRSDSLEDRFKKGVCHLLGLGNYAQSNEAAFKLLEKPALNNHAAAAYLVGWLYYEDKLGEIDVEDCEGWLRLSAKSSYAPALNLLGELYSSNGRAKDLIKAAKYYLKAAQQFDASAQVNLGQMYDDGEGLEVDHEAALKWYLLAAHQGDVEGQYYLGIKYRAQPGMLNDAFQWLLKSAEQHNSVAQFTLGEMHENGEGVPGNNYNAAVMYHNAALNGHVVAQFRAAWLLRELSFDPHYGDEIAKFKNLMVRWFQAAANQNHKDAQYELSLLYREGYGVDQDKESYFYWCRPAAEQQHGIAQAELANLYALGERPNAWLAARWRYHALQNGVSLQIFSAYNLLCLDRDYFSAQLYYDALLNNDVHKFLNILKENDNAISHLFADLYQPLFADDGMFARVQALISKVDLFSVSDVTRYLINKINAQLAISYNKQATNNGKDPRDEETTRILYKLLQNINYADVSSQQVIKLLEMVIDVRLDALEMKLSDGKEIESDLMAAIIQLIARVRSLSTVKLESGLMRLCSAAIIRSCMGAGYEVQLPLEGGLSKKNFYMLVDLFAFNSKFTLADVKKIFGSEIIVNPIKKKAERAEAVEAANTLSSFAAIATVSVGEAGVFGEQSNKRKRDDEPEIKGAPAFKKKKVE